MLRSLTASSTSRSPAERTDEALTVSSTPADEEPARKTAAPSAGSGRLPPCSFSQVALGVLRREMAHLHIRDVWAHLHNIPRRNVVAALCFTALSYWLLSTYEVLALRYLRKKIAYGRIVFTSFIAYSFGHTLDSRIYGARQSGSGCTQRPESRRSRWRPSLPSAAFQSASDWQRSRVLPSLRARPGRVGSASRPLVVDVDWGPLPRCGRRLRPVGLAIEEHAGNSWLALRAPGPSIGLPQVALAMIDLSLAGAVVYWLLPDDANIDFITFLGAYAAR